MGFNAFFAIGKAGRQVLVFFLVVISFTEALPQTRGEPANRTHYLGLQLGGGIGSYREDLVVPISFDGPSFVLGGHYSAHGEQSSLQVLLRFSMAILKNRFSHQAHAAGLELRPSWTRMVWSQGPDKQIWFGIALPMQMRNLFWNSWDDAHLYWLTTHSVALVGEYHTPLPRLGYSVIRLEIPILGFVSRPTEYRLQKQEPLNHFSYHFSAPNGSFAFKGIWEYQSPLLQLLIRRGSKGALLSLGLELALDHCPEPEDVWVLNTRLLFSYQWKIN